MKSSLVRIGLGIVSLAILLSLASPSDSMYVTFAFISGGVIYGLIR